MTESTSNAKAIKKLKELINHPHKNDAIYDKISEIIRHELK